MRVTIESREAVHEQTEGGPGAYLYTFVRASVSDAAGTRSGPFYVPLPADATAAEVEAWIAAQFA